MRDSAPLLDAYLSYFEHVHTPFTIPGHKQQAARLDAGLGQVVDVDTPLYGGLDEVKLTGHVLEHAESLAAQLWGGDFARFSTGGSTHANQAVIFALGKPGDRVAVTRTAHRSVLSALVLAGLEPIWMSPDTSHSSGVPTGITLETLQGALEHKPIAVLLTEPGYLGTMSDLAALIELAHQHHTPVIVDAAWGAHFGFDPAKLVLRANELGTTGIAIEQALLEHRIRIEMADQDTVILLATIADTAVDFTTLADALIPILKELQGPPRQSATALSWSVVPQTGISLRDAYFADTASVPSSQAEGRISADLIAPYPPGVAVVAPGEILTSAIIKGLAASRAAGVRIAYATDPSLETYRVVR